MTIGLIYRVPGLGAVLGCDSRITENTSGEILSDNAEKWGVFGSVVACYAGVIGGLWQDLRENPPKNWKEFRKATTDIEAVQAHDRDYEILVYDRQKDVIWHTDHQGEALKLGLYGGVGTGAAAALGMLDVLTPPRSLEAAEKLLRKNIKLVCRRNSTCGGRIKTLIVRGKRGEIKTVS